MKIDLKSFLIGALSVVCVVLLTGAKDSHEGEVGRYQYADTGHPTVDIIDTRTGVIYNYELSTGIYGKLDILAKSTVAR